MKDNPNAKTMLGQEPRRRDVSVTSERLDPYLVRAKPPGPARCTQCGAIYDRGRWSWGAAAPQAHAATCPACRRIADACPAGEVCIDGAFARAHRDEIISLARHCLKQESAEHALSRLMGIADTDGALRITTTDIHLPRVIAHALERAFKTKAEIRYDDSAHFVRVDWTRDS